jgi:menaquinone-specific isochorismate synthase
MRDAPLLDRPTPARVRARLADEARRARRRDAGPVARVEVPVPATDALAWLAAQPAARRFFWQGRGEAEAVAGAGETLVVEAADPGALEAGLAPWLAGLPEGARFFGYSRFAPSEAPDEAWAPFGRVRFVLPRFELRTGAAGAGLALHLTREDDAEAVAEALGTLVYPPAPRAPALPIPRRRADAPDENGWHDAVTGALRAFASGPLEKVVFARRVRLSFDAPLDPFVLLARLRAETPAAYHVLVGAGEAAFVSATPERLFRVVGRRVATEAVAGTRLRADEAAHDRRLRDALLTSEKDRREHACVRDGIAAALAPLAERLDGAPASTLNHGRIRHLYAPVSGTLRPGVSHFDVLRALHPTPAVAGTPTADALAAIRAREPFDRGLYAGPVGWLGRDAAEFAVGIRSGLVRGTTLDLFSGAGIVAGSDPGAEWAEIEHKLGDFLRVLGGA